MICVAGCGRIGLPMLNALREAGADATGFDIIKKPQDYVSTQLSDICAKVRTLVITVRDTADTHRLLFGDLNVIARATGLERIIFCSTLSPRYLKALQERMPEPVRLIDAPLSGSVADANSRTLSFLLGGDADDLDEVIPLLATTGHRFDRIGPFGSAMQAQVLNTLLMASNTAMTRIILDWAREHDVDHDTLLKVFYETTGPFGLGSDLEQIAFAQQGYDPENGLGMLVKDVAAAIDSAPERTDLHLPQSVMNTLRNLKPLRE